MPRGKMSFPRLSAVTMARLRRLVLARLLSIQVLTACVLAVCGWLAPAMIAAPPALSGSSLSGPLLSGPLLSGLSLHARPAENPAEDPLPSETEAVSSIFFSELMIQPQAVSNLHGEWIELHNGGSEPVNLYYWAIVAHANDLHHILEDFWIQPGQYVVLARHADPGQNGGVQPDYVFTNLELANWSETLRLIDAAGREVDSFSSHDVKLFHDDPDKLPTGTNARPPRIGASVERTGFDTGSIWVEAHSPWPGSAGDWGSPGQGYAPPPTPTPQPSPTPIPSPPAVPPAVRISEVMADPVAVYDEVGEWFEVVNQGDAPVNLAGWTLADSRTDRHVIAADIWLEPGAYAVLGRNADPAINGGVRIDYQYTAITLANGADDLLLIAPWGDEIDRVEWGGETGVPARPGISLERVDWASAAGWVYAFEPWPGSAGDWGSPGAPYLAPTPTPTSTSVPTATPHPTQPPRIRISELMIDPDAVSDDTGEWIELVNLEMEPVNLAGWILRDERQDYHAIAHDLWIEPGAYLVLARVGDAQINGGVHAAYVYQGVRLANDDDALILAAPWDTEVDRIEWGRDAGLPIRSGQSLERTGFDAGAAWVYASSPWSGSAGDWGSPGAPYLAPTPTAVPATLTPTFTPTLTPQPQLPDVPSDTPSIFITEIMVDPHAVADHLGEWFELHNAGHEAVNLAGWRLTDLGRDDHTIESDLWLAPGAYTVLARHGAPLENGGIEPAYVYRGLQFANDGDALLLHTPWGTEADRVLWGPDVNRRVRPGLSLERVEPNLASENAMDAWVEAVEPWPGSAGDWGTPGQAFRPRPATPTPTPPLVLGAAWSPVNEPSALVIDQVYYRTADLEFVTLVNRGNSPRPLTGYVIGDAERPGKQEGLYALPEDVQLAPGQQYVIARRADQFTARWGQSPHAEFEETDPRVPTLSRRRDLASGTWALNDNGDEVILLTPDLQLADGVVFADGDYDKLGVHGELRTGPEESLQRVPGAWFPSITDQRHRFLGAAPDPFASRGLPQAHAQPPVILASGYRAAWGSLGVASTFSPEGLAPPHYLIAAAAADGLDFLALADDDPAPARLSIAQVVAPTSVQNLALIPAWQWQGTDGNRAIVYSHTRFTAATWPDLWHSVAAQGGLVQAQSSSLSRAHTLPHALAIIQADHVNAPGGTADLHRAWVELGEPLLPGGNGAPHMPGLSAHTRYTGLALATTDVHATDHAVDSDSVLAALAQRRGWLTSRPGIWLTLRSTSGVWMGGKLAPNELAPDQQVTLEIEYGDRFGAPAGLALWQDDQILHQLDTPPPDGRWTVQVSAQPGTFLYVVATQLSGDFAVTAPILIETHGEPHLPAPPDSPAPSPPDSPSNSPPDSNSGNSSAGGHATHNSAPDPAHDTRGQAWGPVGSLAMEKLRGLNEWVEFRAQVTVPPGLFNSALYVAEPARLDNGTELEIAGLGIQVYLRTGGVFPPFAEGDWVLVRGQLRTHRGEMEVRIDRPGQVQWLQPGIPLQPLHTTPAAVGEALEGRLITVRGPVVRWQGDSIYLADADDPAAAPVRVTVRSSLDWQRPFVQRGEIYEATGVVSQFASRAPWNGGYRLLVRYPSDLIQVTSE